MASTSDVFKLLGTGATLGIVHVLTGPDHLSALATLSASVGNADAFFLGVRWGIGHSTGLLIVGVALIVISSSSKADRIDMPDYLSHLFESLVGIFMLFLGAYGLRRAYKKKQQQQGDGIIIDDEQPLNVMHHQHDNEMNDETKNGKQSMTSYHSSDSPSTSSSLQEDERYNNNIENTSGEFVLASLDDDNDEISSSSCFSRCANDISTKTMAICVGIVHGLAGPGGVLGVIPAVQLHNCKLAAVYLGCFCIFSTLTMGCYAALYGICSARLGKDGREYQIECFSALLSIVVGITWLVLLSLGKLEDVFP